MIITDKDGSSTISDGKSQLGGGPPSYADATGRPGTSSPARKPPSNYLYVVQQNHSIKGSWTVDPNLNIPPALLPEIPSGTKRQNLLLSSHNGSVSADISIAGDGPGKAFLEARSKNGAVRVVVVDRSIHKKFNLNACSHNGSVTVCIPRDFCGPITFKNGCGSTSFSSAIEEGLTVFSKQNKEGRAFLGDWATAGYGEGLNDSAEAENPLASLDSGWEGDALQLESKNGRVRVFYNDEEGATSGSTFGWFSKWFGGDQSLGQPSSSVHPAQGMHYSYQYQGNGVSISISNPHVTGVPPFSTPPASPYLPSPGGPFASDASSPPGFYPPGRKSDGPGM